MVKHLRRSGDLLAQYIGRYSGIAAEKPGCDQYTGSSLHRERIGDGLSAARPRVFVTNSRLILRRTGYGHTRLRQPAPRKTAVLLIWAAAMRLASWRRSFNRRAVWSYRRIPCRCRLARPTFTAFP